MIYLVSCAVNQQIPEKALVEFMHLDAVYDVAKTHMLAVSVAIALESAGYKDNRSSGIIGAALRKTVTYENAMNRIRQALEEKHIWFTPLKGAVLKDYYPKAVMREFGDYDILFDASREADVNAILEEQRFFKKSSGSHYHTVYCKRPFLIFEMHKALFSNLHEEKIYRYYQTVEQRLIGNGYEKKFTCEDMYLYLIAHEYKHYFSYGTGLRSMLDTYLYLHSQKPEMAYVAAEAEKLGIAAFEKKNRALSFHLFGNGELTAEDRDMLGYVLSSGTFGTRKHNVENQLREKNWSKLHYALDRFVVPFTTKNSKYASFAAKYPFFYQHRILLPVLPFVRVWDAMKKGTLKSELKAIKNAK